MCFFGPFIDTKKALDTKDTEKNLKLPIFDQGENTQQQQIKRNLW